MQYHESGRFIGGLSLRRAAVVAGLAYLLNPVTFSQFYAMPRLAAASGLETVANITAHPHLFAAAVLCYFVSFLGDLVMAWALYVLLAPVNRALSLLASWLQLIYAAMSLAALSNLALLYRVVALAQYRRGVPFGALSGQAALLVDAFWSGWGLALILFALHLIVLGYLLARSRYLPRWLGWLLMADGLAWLVNQLGVYLYPNASLSFLDAFFAVELIFMVWLLGWGWRIKDPELAPVSG